MKPSLKLIKALSGGMGSWACAAAREKEKCKQTGEPLSKIFSLLEAEGISLRDYQTLEAGFLDTKQAISDHFNHLADKLEKRLKK